jgi:hypothetical protein
VGINPKVRGLSPKSTFIKEKNMRKMFLALVAVAMLLVSVSANAEVKFRSTIDHWNTAEEAVAVPVEFTIDHWNTAEEAVAVPVELRQYYVPYFNLHDPRNEKLASGEEMYQLEEDALFLEKVPERLGGTQFVWGKQGNWYVRDARTKQILRDARCGNKIFAVAVSPLAQATQVPTPAGEVPPPTVVVLTPAPVTTTPVVVAPPAPEKPFCGEHPTVCLIGEVILVVAIVGLAIWGISSLAGGSSAAAGAGPHAIIGGHGPGAIIAPAS